MDSITAIAKEVRKNYKPTKRPFTCEFCKRGFSKEKTLLNHVCEQKRRFQQEKDKGVQLGFRTYLRFYELNYSGKNKSYHEFANSNYYNAFVKFGRHIVNINAIDPYSFINFILSNNIKLDKYCNDIYYQTYLERHLRIENWKDAIARSLKTMEKWTTKNNVGLNTYFFAASPNQICNHIVNGRVSSWAIFNCDTGLNFLEKISEEQQEMIYTYIDPDFWSPHFEKFANEVSMIKTTLKEAGL